MQKIEIESKPITELLKGILKHSLKVGCRDASLYSTILEGAKMYDQMRLVNEYMDEIDVGIARDCFSKFDLYPFTIMLAEQLQQAVLDKNHILSDVVKAYIECNIATAIQLLKNKLFSTRDDKALPLRLMAEKLLIALKDIETESSMIAAVKRKLDDISWSAPLLEQMKVETDRAKYGSAIALSDETRNDIENGKRIREKNASLSPKGVKHHKENAARRYEQYREKALEMVTKTPNFYSANGLANEVRRRVSPPPSGDETLTNRSLRGRFSKDEGIKQLLRPRKQK